MVGLVQRQALGIPETHELGINVRDSLPPDSSAYMRDEISIAA